MQDQNQARANMAHGGNKFLAQTSSEVLKLITPSVHQTFVIETNEVSSVLRRHLNRQEPGSAPTELCSSAFPFQLPLPLAMAQDSSTC